MDLNYLLTRHQLSLMSADATTCAEAKKAHLGLATGYADRIRSFQLAAGAASILGDVL